MPRITDDLLMRRHSVKPLAHRCRPSRCQLLCPPTHQTLTSREPTSTRVKRLQSICVGGARADSLLL